MIDKNKNILSSDSFIQTKWSQFVMVYEVSWRLFAVIVQVCLVCYFLIKVDTPNTKLRHGVHANASSTSSVMSYINKVIVNSIDHHQLSKLQKQDYLKKFMPKVSMLEKTLMLQTFDMFSWACKKANMTYILWGGSLLGAYRHHGFIPWDDDLDVMVIESSQMVKDVLSSVPGYTLYSPKQSQWKFFMSDLPSIHGKEFKYPFLDLFIFHQNSSHIFQDKYAYTKKEVYPIQLRVFENRLASVPCRVDRFIPTGSESKCISLWYFHKEGQVQEITDIECYHLYDTFAFVFRQNSSRPGYVNETLKVGNVTLRDILVPQECS